MSDEYTESLMQNHLDTALCRVCGGDGKETCDNPDHNIFYGLYHENPHGCPCCGNDPDHKVKGGGACWHCAGTGFEPMKQEAKP